MLLFAMIRYNFFMMMISYDFFLYMQMIIDLASIRHRFFFFLSHVSLHMQVDIVFSRFFIPLPNALRLRLSHFDVLIYT